MKFSTLIFLATFGTGVFSFIPEGYTEQALQWSVKSPEGQDVSLTGTIEQIQAEYESRFPGHSLPTNPPTSAKYKRQDVWAGSNYECIDSKHPVFGWEPADYNSIKTGWNYLWDLQGNPKPAPGTCGRVSCSHDAGIYICNDNEQEITLSSWADVARGATEVCNQCSAIGLRDKCGGQIFHATDKWNVLVAKDDC